MSKFRLTPAQEAAVKARGSAVLVSAGAGSGKTRVLTERLMGYISDPASAVDIDSFLIITFTKAAAGELRGRIMEELSAAQAADPGNRRLRRQSALCGRTIIGTIHSFCGSLLREYSQEAGLTPDFVIADEARTDAMKSAALERVLEKGYEEPDKHPGFLLLADTVGAGRDDSRLAKLVLELHKNMQCHARPERWVLEQKKLIREPGGGIGGTVWGQEFLRQAGETVEYWSGELDRLMEAAKEDPGLERRFLQSLASGAETVRELGRGLALGWNEAAACPAVQFATAGRAKKDDLKDDHTLFLEDMIKTRREEGKKAIRKIQDILTLDPAGLLDKIRRTAPVLEALLDLTLRFDREFAGDKRRAGLVDYADLEHKAAEILINEDGSPTELAKKVSRRYTEIMVDEYQDVSQVQDDIFRAISRDESNLFLVGDVKQSIYRFRLADPGIFMDKYKRYKDCDEAAPGEPRRILLRENFRSRREILEAANSVFSLCMSEKLGDVDYDEAAALKCAAAYEGDVPVPELMLLPMSKAGDGEENPSKIAREAAFVAGKIRQLVASGEASYGDIALLLRAANADGPIYRRELARLGVPIASGQTGGFFDAVEVATAVALLSVIDNPRQDIPLLTVLRSPVFGFSADELAALRSADKEEEERQARRDEDLYTALTRRAGTDEKCGKFISELAALRQLAPDLSASELVWRLFRDFDMLAVFSAMSDGEQRRARLLALAELSERFESSGYRGLHRFVLWLGKQAERNREPALGGGSEPAVQIMSVHKSKGLEFPVVFLCGMGKKFNQADTRSVVLVHAKLGLGGKLTDTENRVEIPTLARTVISRRMREETLSEELRLLYVAMTRAKERLFITAGLENPEKAVLDAQKLGSAAVGSGALAAMSAPVDWLIQASVADGEKHLRRSIVAPTQEAETAEKQAAPPPEADGAAGEELKRRLAFRYDHEPAVKLPSKVTATELKGREVPDEDAQSLRPRPARPFRMPDFTKSGKPLTGAERGTATHLVLQYMDFAKAGDEAAVLEEIERLRRERFLSDREAQAVDAAAIVKLFASPLGKRMLSAAEAGLMRREFKFSLLCDAQEVFGEARGEQVLLQGVVDCFIEEEGAITVIDYKTDAVRSAQAAAERAVYYAGQLRSYAGALERICQKPVKSCVLYFLSAGEAVTVI